MLTLSTSARFPYLAIILATIGLAGCTNLERLGEVGSLPRMTSIQNPKARPGYRPISMPMPAVRQVTRLPNSLWRTGSRAFFKDQRASRVGDILTVTINIKDKATLNNSSKRARDNTENAGLNALLGYEQSLAKLLPQAIDNTKLIEAKSKTRNDGNGQIARDEVIQLKIAAVITQVLPNGNLVLQGRQEIRVNFEVRELVIAGVIRPEDINSDNTISSEKVAEARISYGGRGEISDVQQPRIGTQIFDILFPF